jgi:hypothetical protein
MVKPPDPILKTRSVHEHAAEHHESATKSHRAAAEHHGKGDHQKGRKVSAAHSKAVRDRAKTAHRKSHNTKDEASKEKKTEK